jgi:hypothetical protein
VPALAGRRYRLLRLGAELSNVAGISDEQAYHLSQERNISLRGYSRDDQRVPQTISGQRALFGLGLGWILVLPSPQLTLETQLCTPTVVLEKRYIQ